MTDRFTTTQLLLLHRADIGRLARVLARGTRHGLDADDLAQDGCVALIRAAEVANHADPNFHGYVMVAAQNAMRDAARRARVRATVPLEREPVVPPDAERFAELRDELLRLAHHYDLLSPAERHCLAEHYGLFGREARTLLAISRDLHVSHRVMKLTHRRAIVRLASRLTKETRPCAPRETPNPLQLIA